MSIRYACNHLFYPPELCILRSLNSTETWMAIKHQFRQIALDLLRADKNVITILKWCMDPNRIVRSVFGKNLGKNDSYIQSSITLHAGSCLKNNTHRKFDKQKTHDLFNTKLAATHLLGNILRRPSWFGHRRLGNILLWNRLWTGARWSARNCWSHIHQLVIA